MAANTSLFLVQKWTTGFNEALDLDTWGQMEEAREKYGRYAVLSFKVFVRTVLKILHEIDLFRCTACGGLCLKRYLVLLKQVGRTRK